MQSIAVADSIDGDRRWAANRTVQMGDPEVFDAYNFLA
jgi:hypothetical protein